MLPWKKKFLYFYFLGDLVFSVLYKYHLNLVMVFDLAFQMKCKYKLSKSANVPQMSSILVHIFFFTSILWRFYLNEMIENQSTNQTKFLYCFIYFLNVYRSILKNCRVAWVSFSFLVRHSTKKNEQRT